MMVRKNEDFIFVADTFCSRKKDALSSKIRLSWNCSGTFGGSVNFARHCLIGRSPYGFRFNHFRARLTFHFRHPYTYTIEVAGDSKVNRTLFLRHLPVINRTIDNRNRTMDDFIDIPPGVIPISGFEVTKNDVLCGRGGSINCHPGNERFRQLVDSKKRLYLTARFKREKRLIASRIVDEIHALNPPGRFLTKIQVPGATRGKKKATDMRWYEVDIEKARDKTSQALRENAPEIRKEMEDERIQYVAGQGQHVDDDYDDQVVYHEEDVDNEDEIYDAKRHQVNGSDAYSWIPSFPDVQISSSWNSFRANVSSSAAAFIPYSGSIHGNEQVSQVPSSTQQGYSSSISNDSMNQGKSESHFKLVHFEEEASATEKPRHDRRQSLEKMEHVMKPWVQYSQGNRDRIKTRTNHNQHGVQNSATHNNLPMHYPSTHEIQPQPQPSYYQGPHTPDHPSMAPPPPPQHKYEVYDWGTPSRSSTSVAVVSPEKATYHRAPLNEGHPQYQMSPESHYYPHHPGYFNREHQLQMQSNGENGDSNRTIDSQLVQSKQSWEQEMGTDAMLHDHDVEMENAKVC